MNILVTGATGYIGGRLVERFLCQGHQVAAIVRPGSSTARLRGAYIHLYDGSIGSLSRALEASGAQQVFHLASLYLSRHESKDVDRLIASNLLFPTQLLEAMTEAGVRQFINTGTGWQHYQDAPYDPVNLYAATKQAFGNLMEYYVRAAGFSAVTLKILESFGPGDRRPKLFNLLRNAALTSVPLKMSPGEQRLDFIYIEDIVDAFELASRRVMDIAGAETFGLGSGHTVSLRELVTIYSTVTGRDIPIEWGALPYRQREVMTSWTDYPMLPGWRARTSLAEGIALMESAPGGLLAGQPS